MNDSSSGCFFKTIAIINIIIIAIILVDFYGEEVRELRVYEGYYNVDEYVPDTEPGYQVSKSTHNFIRSTDGSKVYIPIDSKIRFHLKPADTFYKTKTAFLGKAKYLETPKMSTPEKVSIFYTVVISCYIICGVYSVVYLFIKSNGVFETFLGFSLVGVLIITGMYLFMF